MFESNGHDEINERVALGLGVSGSCWGKNQEVKDDSEDCFELLKVGKEEKNGKIYCFSASFLKNGLSWFSEKRPEMFWRFSGNKLSKNTMYCRYNENKQRLDHYYYCNMFD